MKITAIELCHISIPFAKPYALSKTYGTLSHAHAVIFKIHTDEGIVGLGEADPLNPFTEETPASVMVVTRDVIAPLLMGQDPCRISALESKLDNGVHSNLTARGAVNMALYDIAGKFYDIPAHMLLGGAIHTELPILGAIGSGTSDEDADAIDALIDQGHTTVMIKMGALPIVDEMKRMAAAHQRFGGRVPLIVDANQAWEVAEALAFVDGIRSNRPDLLEQPIKRWDIEGLKRIRDRAPCPVSADESLSTIKDAATLIGERAVDVFSIKVSKNGGIYKSKQIAAMADGFGLKCLMNSMLEFGVTQAASLQLGCTLSNLMNCGHAYGSVLRMSDDITDFGENIAQARITVPSGSGLGVELNEKKLKKYTQDYLKISS
jgi:muconate cycloisomerase